MQYFPTAASERVQILRDQKLDKRRLGVEERAEGIVAIPDSYQNAVSYISLPDSIAKLEISRLAYEIKDCTEGFYCLFNVTCEPACVAECDRVMKITDEILKHMIVKSDEE